MSDISTEGPPDKPYRENPPTHFVEVHWTGGNTTWPTRPFSYLECAAAVPPLTESYYGTASFWLRVNGALTVEPEIPHFEVIPILTVTGPERADWFHDVFYLSVEHETVAQRLYVRGHNDRLLGLIRIVSEPIANFPSGSDLPDAPSTLINNAWAHFLLTWDLLTRTGTITINKVGQPNYPLFHFTAHLVFVDGTPQYVDFNEPGEITAPVAWQQTPRYFGALWNYDDIIVGGVAGPHPAEPLASNYLISLAHVWVSTKQRITDVSKFVGADNKPAPFGPGGEITITPAGPGGIPPAVTVKPEFYFHGGPSSIVTNAGTGGKAKLIGEPPTGQTIAPQIGA